MFNMKQTPRMKNFISSFFFTRAYSSSSIQHQNRMNRKYYDIGLNLTDDMFQGLYNGKIYHASDITQVLGRASRTGVKEALLTGSSVVESRKALELAHKYSSDELQLGYTVGVHPCSVNEFAEQCDGDSNEDIFRKVADNPSVAYGKLDHLYELMKEAIHDSGFRAIGEIGLDYDRLSYACREMQLTFFEEQLKLSCLVGAHMPLFLHMRASCLDFIAIMKKFIDGFQDDEDKFSWGRRCNVQGPIRYQFQPTRKFVTHSFTGTAQELSQLLALSSSSFIGINGCSLRSEENVQCCKMVPLERLLLETDAPWCGIKRSDASYKYLSNYESPFKSVKRNKLSEAQEINDTMVKGRNEPCSMEQVAVAVANIKGLDLPRVTDKVWDNSIKVYGNANK